jgi:hypothetical protein
MTFLRLLIVFPVSFALCACGASLPVKPADNPGGTDNVVMKAIARGTVVEQSVLRDADKVSLSVRSPSGERLYLQTGCASGYADWLYADLAAGKEKRAGTNRRYSSGTALYSLPVALSAKTVAAINRLPEVQQACERTPEWREAAYDKREDTQILLDISSLQKQADGSLRFWAAVDYPYRAYIRNSRAPYSRKAGYYQIDCRRHIYSLLYTYYLDQKQTVTDGGLVGRSPILNFNQAFSEHTVLLSTVCEQVDVLTTLPPPPVRDKQFPDFVTLSAPEAAITEQIERLKLAPPRQTLSRLRVEGTRTSKGASASLRLRDNAGAFQQDTTIERTATPGVFRIEQHDGNDTSEQLSFLGLIPVSQTFNSPLTQSTSRLEKLELRGDWNAMPVGGQLSYRQSIRVVEVFSNQSRQEVEVICKVIRVTPAQELNARLQGNAKEFRCHELDNRDDEISVFYYLEEYGYAFQIGSVSNRYAFEAHVADFR